MGVEKTRKREVAEGRVGGGKVVSEEEKGLRRGARGGRRSVGERRGEEAARGRWKW